MNAEDLLCQAITDESSNPIIHVLGIGKHGCQAVAMMRQNPWFAALPYKYMAIADQQDKLKGILVDEVLLIETRLEKNTESSVLLDALIQEKLDNRDSPDIIFMLSALEDAATISLHQAIAGHFYNPEQTRVIALVIQPDSDLGLPTFQKRLSRLKRVRHPVNGAHRASVLGEANLEIFDFDKRHRARSWRRVGHSHVRVVDAHHCAPHRARSASLVRFNEMINKNKNAAGIKTNRG